VITAGGTGTPGIRTSTLALGRVTTHQPSLTLLVIRRRSSADRNDYNTEFGPTNVILYEVNIAIELGDVGHVLRVAAKVDTARLSPERQAAVDRCGAGIRPATSTALMVSILRQPEQVARSRSARTRSSANWLRMRSAPTRRILRNCKNSRRT
jgi:hypothetical protein